MRRISIFAVWFLAVSAVFASVDSGDALKIEPDMEHRYASNIATRFLTNYHYKRTRLDDDLSSEIFETYLKLLDPSRVYFLASDIESFERYRSGLDDALRHSDLMPAYDIFNVYAERVQQRVDYARKRVQQPFDFTVDEYYEYDREDAPWATSEAGLDELWRQRVKNDYLRLLLTDKERDAIVETLTERYDNLERRINELNTEDVFQFFMNAFAQSIEPHTAYLSARTSENFEISMKLSLEGIGALLGRENEYTVISSVVPGGPADQDGRLKAGDRIIAVGQGNDGKMVDVIGWRIDDVVDLIRGPKDSVVRLNILPKNQGVGGRTREVVLVRDEIKLEDKAAKSEVIKAAGGVRLGVIEIPAFYRDFGAQAAGDEDFRSTTRDVRTLLDDLQRQKVDGIIIDLRRNGGGSLSEATELTGLFIEKGPVVQVKDSSGRIEVERDPDPEQVYAGPLAVLVDRNSASASEIFAGAIQDYNRGLILGEPTFGKGTVQTLVDLGRFLRSREDIGRLRLTMAQFFRVQGGSTQHRGVMPDIVYPTAKGAADHGERALDNALPWASIKPADHQLLGEAPVSSLRDASKQRIADNEGFRFLLEEEEDLIELDKKTTVSLRESVRRAEWDEREKERLDRRNRLRAFRDLPPLASLDKEDDDETSAEDEKDLEGIQRIMLEESANILAEQILSMRPRTALVN